MNADNKLSQTLVDAVASEALGANTPADSAAYRQELASAGDSARRLDCQLNETVARLAAASPFMQPSADLRGRILQATAPAAFRMEDYRHVTRDNSRLYRWGCYAAMAFLAAGAWFNIHTQNQLRASQNQVAALSQQANERNVALAAFVNPNADQITFTDNGQANGKVIGKALLDGNTKTAVVILPPGMVPAGHTPQLSITKNGTQVTYQTVLITAPADMLQAPSGTSAEAMLAIKGMSPDPKRPQIAGK